MRSHFGMALVVVAALGAVVACPACSSSSGSPQGQPDAGGGCTDTFANVLNNPAGVFANAATSGQSLCPVDANGNPQPYDEAITTTCTTLKQKVGDVEYGQCFQYLVFQIDLDSTGKNFTRCFYDPGSHALIGVLYSDGKGQDQCGGTASAIAGGTADPSCSISGLHGGGSGFQSCVPVVDAGNGGG